MDYAKGGHVPTAEMKLACITSEGEEKRQQQRVWSRIKVCRRCAFDSRRVQCVGGTTALAPCSSEAAPITPTRGHSGEDTVAFLSQLKVPPTIGAQMPLRGTRGRA